MKYASLRLKKYEEKRLLQGHLWVYSNEIDTKQCPFSDFSSGQLVHIEDYRGRFLGTGYVNPHTLLCARILTRDSQQKLDVNFFEDKIRRALQLRTAFFSKPFYRLIFAESDGLPGLIVDRYHDLLVGQITTAGMDNLQDMLVEALNNVVNPVAILWRNDHAMRIVEGLPQYVRAAWGEPPQQTVIEENEISFLISPWEGQKTGWFYDHRDNRRRLKYYVKDKRVLDVFTYLGAWGVQAAVFGAKQVCALDSSASALKNLQDNAKLNKVDAIVNTIQADAFDQLKMWVEQQLQFDVIILDPPAFIKKKKDYGAGFAAYKKLNSLALQLLAPGGYLISASCSQHLSTDQLREAILTGAVNQRRNLQILARGHQGLDHPVHPAIVETDYLKAFFCRV